MMLIDEYFSSLVYTMSANNHYDVYGPLLDGITAIDISSVVSYLRSSCPGQPFIFADRDVNFPKRTWFEFGSSDFKYDSNKVGVLSFFDDRWNDKQIITKELNQVIKRIAKGKLFGLFSKRKPILWNASKVHIMMFFCFMKQDKNPHVLGMTYRVLDDNFNPLTSVLITFDRVNFSSSILLVGGFTSLVLATQDLINSHKSLNIRSNDMSRLHIERDASIPDGFKYKLSTINLNNTTTTREPNPDGGGWKMGEHERSGYTCERRYHTKKGVITKTVHVKSYRAGHGKTRSHTDLRVIIN